MPMAMGKFSQLNRSYNYTKKAGDLVMPRASNAIFIWIGSGNTLNSHFTRNKLGAERHFKVSLFVV